MAQSHRLLVFTAEPGTCSHAELAALRADPQAYSREDLSLVAATGVENR